ncbi:cellulase family glycosylhydrolase [Parabacteroides sp. OttesenSCG-928-N08]|nr:cellulase family glycosylhydrolase [Parabacteroides sp. OttesenSCG-928-N08]
MEKRIQRYFYALLATVLVQSLAAQLPDDADHFQAQFGVNMSGGEFSGSFGIYPDNPVDWDYYAGKGLKLIRLPIKWERLQTEPGGELVRKDLEKVKQVVELAHGRGMKIMLDVHNYGRGHFSSVGKSLIIGESEQLTREHFADFWRKMATEFKEYRIWGYDLMNEPHDMGRYDWLTTAQTAIDAIREIDADTHIIIEGNNWASADTWQQSSDMLKGLVDPANKIVYQAHCYFDADGSGTYKKGYAEEVGNDTNRAIRRLSHFVEWLHANDKRGMIGELGCPGDDERWLEMLDGACRYLKENNVSLTYWSGGRHWGNYALGIHPPKETMSTTPVDKSQMKVLEKYGDGYGEAPTGIEAESVPLAGAEVSIHPNPVRDALYIRSDSPLDELVIYSLNGEAMMQKKITANSYVALDFLPAGSYVVRLLPVDGLPIIRKLIKR